MGDPIDMTRSDWAGDVDMTVPNVARIYDYNIGGRFNFEADRLAAERIHELNPYVRNTMRENRHFLRRATTFLADPQGGRVSQFLDIGAGLPTHGNVHEVAQSLNPDARVVYVDNDPVVLTHARALMAGDDNVQVVAGDIRQVEQILDNPVVQNFIDWDKPVGLMLIAILHFVSDEHDPQAIITTLHERLPAGSYLALTHGTIDGAAKLVGRSRVKAAKDQYKQTAEPLSLRSRAAIQRLINGFDLLSPGLVALPSWRPDGISEGLAPEMCGAYGCVARARQL